MVDNFAGTITPWALGTLLIISLLSLGAAAKAWRNMKRSPYFFMRRQAEKHLQTYLSVSMVLFALSLGVFAYSWQTPTEEILRVAILTNAKPPTEEVVALVESMEIAEVIEEEVAAITTTEVVPAALADSRTAVSVLELPAEFDTVEPEAEIQENTELGDLTFSTEMNQEFEAVDPRRIFAEGSYTLYATFPYDGMVDGLAWSWVWRYNGEVVGGGNELWTYGIDGPGYIFLNPETGFGPGDYTLEIWVNGELMAYSTAVMNTAAAAAGN